MTKHKLTPEEVAAADAEFRQMWLSLLTFGLIPKPKREYVRWLDRQPEAGA